MPVRLVDEEAGDPPIRRVIGGLAVGASELDPWQLVGSTELAPADAHVAIEDERRVRLTVTNAPFLLGPTVGSTLRPLRMELHAPAAAPYTVVPLHETREVGPRVLVQRLDVIVGHRRKASREMSNPVMERSGNDLPIGTGLVDDPAVSGGG